jgi:hypothetical protein
MGPHQFFGKHPNSCQGTRWYSGADKAKSRKEKGLSVVSVWDDGILGPAPVLFKLPGSSGYYPLHFFTIQRLCQNVVSTHIQHLGPEVLIGRSRGDYQLGRERQAAQVAEHGSPVPFGQIALGDDHVHFVPLQRLHRPATIVRFQEAPAALAKNVMHQQAFARVFAHQQGGERHVLRGVGHKSHSF